VGELKSTKITLQLADRSIKIPREEIKNVLINVGEFIFSVNFIVLETTSIENPRGQIPVILGRPFIATSNALINCHSTLIKLIFENMMSDLNIFNLGRQPSDPSDQLFEVNIIQGMSSDHFKEDHMDSDFGCTYQNFEKLCEKEIKLFEEVDQLVNHVSLAH